MNKPISFAFFGSSHISVLVLDILRENGYVPTVIITGEDKPQGRKMVLTPPETKVWAEKNSVECLQYKTLKTDEVYGEIREKTKNCDVFIVVSYGKLLPERILDLPKHKTINLHPSLLPRLRGASPIQSAILTEDETGVTIMKLDAEMDHGPILAQEKIVIKNWPPYADVLEETLAQAGGKMLVELLPQYIAGNVQEKKQDHTLATFCSKIQKIDGEINIADNPEINLRKIRAYAGWPGAYFFLEHKDKKMRVIIKTAHIDDGKLVIDRVVPEGKKEMLYADFVKGLR